MNVAPCLSDVVLLISAALGDVLVCALLHESEVVRAGDAEQGVVDAVALQSAVTDGL